MIDRATITINYILQIASLTSDRQQRYIVQIICYIISTYPILSHCLFHGKGNRYIKETGCFAQSVVSASSFKEILGVPMHSYTECDSRIQTRESRKERNEEKREIEGAMH